MANTFGPKSLEKTFERRHVNQIIGAENEMERIFKLAADDISKTIRSLERKRKLDPSKYGNQLLRNKSLKKQLIQMRDDLNKHISASLNSNINEGWNMANSKNDDLVNGYLKGLKPLSASSAAKYYNVNDAALNNFINRKIKGLNLSDKVWNLANDTKALVEDWVGTGITQGKSAAKISSEMFKMMGDPNAAKVVNDAGKTIRFNKVSQFLRTPAPKGHYKNPRASIKRLVRTEINRSYRDSDGMRYKQLDFVVGKEVHLSAAHADFDICDNLKGPYPKTFIFDGWHPNCLCYVTSILMTKEEFRNGISTADSKNFIRKVPVTTQRFVKTTGSSNKNYNWYDKNFKNNIPIKNVGGPSKGVKKYKNMKSWTYEANPEKYLQKAKKNLVPKKPS